jgi:hypothetical protein
MAAVSRTFNPRKPYSTLMKGRPDEPESWQSLAVYSKNEEAEFRGRGWKPSKEFMNSADRARRRDT